MRNIFSRQSFRQLLFINTVIPLVFLIFMFVPMESVALTADEVLEHTVAVYDSIDDYTVVVRTYKVDSMSISESVLDAQEPNVSFDLFYKKPDKHRVKISGESRLGIFRVELLSTLHKLKDLTLSYQGKARILGETCRVIEVISPDRPGEAAKLWVEMKDWKVRQIIFYMNKKEMVTTQFQYSAVNREHMLPTETRSFFPKTKWVLVNKIENYKVNVGLSSELFDQKRRRHSK